MIFKIVRKSMFKKRGLLLSILLLVLLTSILVGFNYFSFDRLNDNFLQMKDQVQVEDFRMYTIPELEDEYTEKLISGVEDDNDITLEYKPKRAYKSGDSDKSSYGFNRYDPEAVYNQIILFDGKLPKSSGEVVVQPGYLETLNKKIGDEIKIEDQTFTISGSAYFIDYVIPLDYSLGIINPDFDNFAPLYMNAETFDKLDDNLNLIDESIYAGTFNQKNLTTDEKKVAYEKIKNDYAAQVPLFDQKGLPQINSTGEPVTKDVELFPIVLGYSSNLVISGVETEVEARTTMFGLLSNLLIILTVFLTIALVNSIFKAQRREIGILEAEGISRGKLGINFLVFIVVLVIIGMIIGGVFSYPVSTTLYNIDMSIYQVYDYPVSQQIIIDLILNYLLILVVLAVLVYFISIRRNLNQKILNLIKNIDKDKRPKHNVTKYFSRLSFLRKFQISIILRNFSKTILLFIAILTSSFLLLLGTLMYTSVEKIMNNTYNDVFTYSYKVQYGEGQRIDAGKNTGITVSADILEFGKDGKKEVDKEDDTLSIEAYNFAENDLIHVTGENGNEINDEKNGLIVTEGVLKKYNLAVGDMITVANPYNVDKEVEFEIVDVTTDYFLPTAFVDSKFLQKKFDLDQEYANTTFGTGTLTKKEKDDIFAKSETAQISENTDLIATIEDKLGIVRVAILIIAILAALISFITMFTISSIIIDSNSKTISVMKVLGYTDGEIKRMTVGIYKWFVVIIYIVLIPVLNFGIGKTVEAATEGVDFSLDVSLNFFYSLVGLTVIFVVYLISSQLTYGKIKKIKLSESLKIDE